MDFLKNQLERLQAQFGQLTASQKMLSVSLIAIMIMTLAWWGRYAGTPEMQALLDQDLSTEDFSRISNNLRMKGIPFTTSGMKILVPADRQYQTLGDLAGENLLPRDTSSAFTDLMGKMGNPLNPHETTQAIMNQAKQLSLAEIIRHMPGGILSARVELDVTEKRRIDNPIFAKASVSVNMKQLGSASSTLVDAIATVVANSVASLDRSRVSVIVDGATRLAGNGVDSEDSGFGSGSQDELQKLETRYAKRIYDHLSFCDNVHAQVKVELKADSTLTTAETYDPKGIVSRPSETTTELQSTNSGSRPSGDPGVNPNTGSNQTMAIGSGGESTTSTTEKNTEKTENHFGKKVQVTKTPPTMVVASASVFMPRSFFIKAYKIETQTDKDPSETLLEPYIKKLLESYRGQVRNIIGLTSDDSLSLDTYVDLLPTAPEITAQAIGGVAVLLGSHGKDIVLGVLALASLFMVSMMVRKGGSAGSVVTAGARSVVANHSTMPTVGTTVDAMIAKAKLKALVEDDAAEVGAGGQALDGIELDDDSIRAQQVIEQVSTLVKENPDVGASLIKRWMTHA